MKFDLTIKGVSLAEAQDIMLKLSEESDENVTSESDADGLVWDARIHSSTKKKADTGKWVRRRGVAEDTFLSVVAELKPVQQFTPPVQPVQPVQQFTPPVQQFTPPAMPVQQFTPPVSDMNTLLTRIQGLFVAGTADANYINSITGRLQDLYQVQVNSINDISNRPDMIQTALQIIQTDGK